MKLLAFKNYYNGYRVHAALEGKTPMKRRNPRALISNCIAGRNIIVGYTQRQSQPEEEFAMDRVKESEALIYTVGMYSNNQIEIRSTSEARDELKQLAEMAGAPAHFPSDLNKGREAMEKIAREVSEHYTIGYCPSNPAHYGAWRKNKGSSPAARTRSISRARAMVITRPASRNEKK